MASHWSRDAQEFGANQGDLEGPPHMACFGGTNTGVNPGGCSLQTQPIRLLFGAGPHPGSWMFGSCILLGGQEQSGVRRIAWPPAEETPSAFPTVAVEVYLSSSPRPQGVTWQVVGMKPERRGPLCSPGSAAGAGCLVSRGWALPAGSFWKSKRPAMNTNVRKHFRP